MNQSEPPMTAIMTSDRNLEVDRGNTRSRQHPLDTTDQNNARPAVPYPLLIGTTASGHVRKNVREVGVARAARDAERYGSPLARPGAVARARPCGEARLGAVRQRQLVPE